jgi:hypothetical protein
LGFLHRRIAFDLRDAGLVYRELSQTLLGLGIMSFHPCEGSLHLAQDPHRFGDQFRITIAFMSGDQMKLALNPQALVENLLFPHFNSLLGRDSRIGRAMETPALSKGSRLQGAEATQPSAA